MSMDEDDVDAAFAPIDEPIDFGLVYALHTFVANLEGQVCVLKGDSLELLDDSNSYWWLVKCIKTDEIGYIPAENVETPFERLARLNKHRNVTVTLVQGEDFIIAEQQAQAARENPNRRNIVFSEYHEEIFEDEDDDEDEASVVSSQPSSPVASSPKGREGTPKMGFFSKLLKRGSSKKKNEIIPPKQLEKPQVQQPPESPTATTSPAIETTQEPINVLRIFAGNVDLKATFKTVALTHQMTTAELLASALKRFRVPGASTEDWYLTVLHMDSQEKRLKEEDNVFNVLEELRHKSLPGIGDFSHLAKTVVSDGRVSSVRMNDDNIIKVIINKQLNLFEKNFHLMRILLYADDDPTGKMRQYKTIGASSESTVEEVVQLAVKKFKLPPTKGFVFTLVSNIKGEEIARDNSERILPLVKLAESGVDVTFILRRTWTGPGAAPVDSMNTTFANASPNANTSLMDDIKNILQHKPGFLDELPNTESGAQKLESVMKGEGDEESEVGTAKQSDVEGGAEERDTVPREGGEEKSGGLSDGEGPAPEILARKTSLRYDWDIVMRDARMPPEQKLLEQAGDVSGVMNGKIIPGVGEQPGRTSADGGADRSDVGTSENVSRRSATADGDQPVIPPKSGRRSSQSSRRGSQASQTSSVSTSLPTEPVPALSGRASPLVDRKSIDTERKSSDLSRPASRLDSRSPSAEVELRQSYPSASVKESIDESQPTTLTVPPRAPSEAQSDSDLTPVQRRPSTSKSQVTDDEAAESRSSTANFAMMEEYLDEMLTGEPDTNKLANLETAIRQSTLSRKPPTAPPTPSHPVPKSPSTTRPPHIITNGVAGQYDDSGLGDLLKRKTLSPKVPRAPSRMGMGDGGAMMSPASSVGSARERELSTIGRSYSARSGSLSQIFEDMTVDLERSLSRSRGRAGGKGAVGNGGPEGGGGVGGGGGTGKPGLDSAVGLDKYKEAEAMLGNMQRDLDNIVSNAVSVYRVQDSLSIH
ncbi:hypothetical protein HDV00_001653 [Rhizophlyctis rosea]|nr:hypothetical protein HDV00_001653 [Rhizophlyctis rosea]